YSNIAKQFALTAPTSFVSSCHKPRLLPSVSKSSTSYLSSLVYRQWLKRLSALYSRALPTPVFDQKLNLNQFKIASKGATFNAKRACCCTTGLARYATE